MHLLFSPTFENPRSSPALPIGDQDQLHDVTFAVFCVVGLNDSISCCVLQFKFPACAPNLESKFPVRRFDFDGRTLSEAGFDLLSSLLTLDPERRATAQAALEHKW